MITLPIKDLYLRSCFGILLLSIYSYRKGSIQLSGAVTGFLIGYLTLANPNPIFGISLLTFYLAGNLATKYKQSLKTKLVENEHRTSSLKSDGPQDLLERPPGRDWKQVLCNAWIGTLSAILYRLLINTNQTQSDHEMSDVDDQAHAFLKSENHTTLVNCLTWAAIAFWSGCCGDTVSEIKPQNPILKPMRSKGPLIGDQLLLMISMMLIALGHCT